MDESPGGKKIYLVVVDVLRTKRRGIMSSDMQTQEIRIVYAKDEQDVYDKINRHYAWKGTDGMGRHFEPMIVNITEAIY